ncbi:hypothetical protein Baya_10132 [Bagarius yarrelli]|uniref:Uncharacterized protein n=1 Tax=Bagarius yarrelli TaxID=175774 RepID=A0A556UF10_BAGYA|nr:hypothetical protein Baya_10132 [Bagarius yarrelli]
MNWMSGLCRCFENSSSEEEGRRGRITTRQVGVPDLDQRFNDFAETFNKQQENYECLQEKWQTLMSSYKCAPNSSLSECLQKIKDEHPFPILFFDNIPKPNFDKTPSVTFTQTPPPPLEDHQISLQMKGYNFSLAMTPDDPIPDKLKQTQENIKELCQAVKAIVALGPKLEEMINWLLNSEKSLIQTINTEATTHQESTRLGSNLRENLSEALRAKELSPHYREEARKRFNEVAVLSGVEL